MKKAFTLIELIVVIAITAVLLAVAIPNLLGARERARDAARKQEMNELKNALRLYYNDFQQYPASSNIGGGCAMYTIKGCGTDNETCCPCNTTTAFAVGAEGSECSTLYMKKFPSDFGTKTFYPPSKDTDSFCLYTLLENAADPDIAVSQAKCADQCPNGQCAGSNYCVCAD
jgi:prepilin-type N-terminal cleavage/methylation domain-containing protein